MAVWIADTLITAVTMVTATALVKPIFSTPDKAWDPRRYTIISKDDEQDPMGSIYPALGPVMEQQENEDGLESSIVKPEPTLEVVQQPVERETIQNALNLAIVNPPCGELPDGTDPLHLRTIAAKYGAMPHQFSYGTTAPCPIPLPFDAPDPYQAAVQTGTMEGLDGRKYATFVDALSPPDADYTETIFSSGRDRKLDLMSGGWRPSVPMQARREFQNGDELLDPANFSPGQFQGAAGTSTRAEVDQHLAMATANNMDGFPLPSQIQDPPANRVLGGYQTDAVRYNPNITPTGTGGWDVNYRMNRGVPQGDAGANLLENIPSVRVRSKVKGEIPTSRLSMGTDVLPRGSIVNLDEGLFRPDTGRTNAGMARFASAEDTAKSVSISSRPGPVSGSLTRRGPVPMTRMTAAVATGKVPIGSSLPAEAAVPLRADSRVQIRMGNSAVPQGTRTGKNIAPVVRKTSSVSEFLQRMQNAHFSRTHTTTTTLEGEPRRIRNNRGREPPAAVRGARPTLTRTRPSTVPSTRPDTTKINDIPTTRSRFLTTRSGLRPNPRSANSRVARDTSGRVDWDEAERHRHRIVPERAIPVVT